MTKDQKRVLQIMREGREYTAGDIETLAKVRGWYLGKPINIARIMVQLKAMGLIESTKVEQVLVYSKAEEVNA